jgi:hypothetical protein
MTRIFQFITTTAVVLAMMFGVLGNQAEAARGWCLADPVVVIDGQLADIFVQSDLTMLTSATGPIKMVITIPEGSKGSVLLTDLGFLRGYSISWAYSSSLQRTRTHTQVQVKVYAPSRATLPVSVTFAPRYLSTGLIALLVGQSASGSSNSWVTLRTS